MSVDSEAKIYFLEADGTPSSADRILTGDENLNVTVVSDGNNGYLLEYDLPSETYEQAVVAQFALYGGQTIHIENLAGGTVYYVYEYAAGDGSEDGTVKLVNDWNTEIVISPQGANQGTEDILDDYEMVIQDELPEYRQHAVLFALILLKKLNLPTPVESVRCVFQKQYPGRR